MDQPTHGMSREYLIKGFEDKDVQHYYNYMVEVGSLNDPLGLIPMIDPQNLPPKLTTI